MLGLASFLGLAVLVLLYFQQARDVRRLREWAGKAPERAAAARQSTGTGEAVAISEEAQRSPRMEGAGRALAGMRERFGERWRALDRRSPLDLRILATLTVLALGAAAVLSSGFGLVGGEEGRARSASTTKADEPPPSPSEIEVAVLNGTTSGTAPGIPGLAGEAGRRVSSAGFELGAVGDTSTPFSTSVVMFEPTSKDAAKVVADELQTELGELRLERMTGEVRTLAGDSGVVLVVGQDNADL